MPPPHRSMPSLDAQPSLLSALLLNDLKKRSCCFRARKVSICFVIDIFVCKKYYYVSSSPARLLFRTGEWSNPTPIPPNSRCLVYSRCGRPGEVSLVLQIPISVGFVGLNVCLNITTPLGHSFMQTSGPHPLPTNRIGLV
jgi:hypothetical protein